METSQTENSIEIAKLTEDYKYLNDRYIRDCSTFNEMSNNLNWTLSLVTAQFLYFIDKLFVATCGLSSLFFALIVLGFGLSICLFLQYKIKYIEYKKSFDDVLSVMTEKLNAAKYEGLNIDTIKTKIGALIRMLEQISNERFELKKVSIELPNSTKDLLKSTSLDDISKKLKCSNKWGMRVSVVSLFILPLFLILKYIFVHS